MSLYWKQRGAAAFLPGPSTSRRPSAVYGGNQVANLEALDVREFACFSKSAALRGQKITAHFLGLPLPGRQLGRLTPDGDILEGISPLAHRESANIGRRSTRHPRLWLPGNFRPGVQTDQFPLHRIHEQLCGGAVTAVNAALPSSSKSPTVTPGHKTPALSNDATTFFLSRPKPQR